MRETLKGGAPRQLQEGGAQGDRLVHLAQYPPLTTGIDPVFD